ncbi:Synphilin-1 [Manis pentadactyla]|nr:Synphilin-1 [Manis pentadactyla]
MGAAPTAVLAPIMSPHLRQHLQHLPPPPLSSSRRLQAEVKAQKTSNEPGKTEPQESSFLKTESAERKRQ